MSKSVIIIGSGIAGLSAGIYSQMNGYNSVIYEMQKNPGGLCSAWKRQNFVFDGCIHWLTGTDPSSDYYHLWEEIGAIQDKTFYYYDYFFKLRDTRGDFLTFYCDPYLLRAELSRVAPEDMKFINKWVNDLRTLRDNPLPVEIGFRNIRRSIRALRILYRYRMNAKEFSKNFTNEYLRDVIAKYLDWHGMSIGFTFWAMTLMAVRNAGYPIGGSRQFILPVVKKYEDLGGKIVYQSKVEKILVENGKAAGIKLANGEEVRGDIVISAADGRSAIFDWLEGKFVDEKITGLYNSLEQFPPIMLFYFGIRGIFKGEPHDFTTQLSDPLVIAGKEYHDMAVKIYNFDPTLSSSGKTVFMVMLNAEFDYWKNLKDKSKDEYFLEKKAASDKVLNALGEVYPDISMRVEVADVVTPMTFYRYSGNNRGSYQGWILNKDSMLKKIPQVLPGLQDFYMVGHWTTPGGGLPSGVITSRKVVKMMCKADKKEFITNK